ncbi:MAG: MFS transporter [Steroidobacteraceae bacterium]|nr:MFS transporter [Steroidobacteraceae bacterium]
MKVREILALARGYPTRLWLTCFGAYALSQMDLALWSYALPVIRVEFDMSRTGIGVLTGAAFGLGGVALVWLGMLADRIGRKKTMIGGIVAASVFVAAHGLAMNPVALGALRAASMASGGLLYPATGALVAEEAPAKIRGLMTGLLQVAYPLGWFLASMLAVLVLADHGWRVLFIAGLIGLPFALVVKRAVRESSRFVAPAANAPRPSLGALFAPGIRRRTVTLFLAQYFFVIAYGGAFIFSPLYFHEARGFDIAGTATLVGLSNLIGVLGYFLAAWVGEFYLTRRTTTVIWTLLGSVFFVVFLWFTDGYAASMVAFSVMAVFLLGAAAVKFAYIAELFPTHLRATGLAFCGSFAVSLGQATGPALIGWLADTRGWNVAMFVGGALPLLVAGILYLYLKPLPSGLDVDEVQRRLAT